MYSFFIRRNIFLHFFVIACFTLTSALGQEIQWASSIDHQENESDQKDWSAEHVLGEPNAVPFGKINPKAYRAAGDSQTAKIAVSFDQPQRTKQILILENHAPGHITGVTIQDEQGQKHTIYRDSGDGISLDYRILCLTLPELTNYKVSGIEVVLNPSKGKSPQIDAIGLATSSGTQQLRNKIESYNKKGVAVVKFTDKKEDLGQTINSKYAEKKPIISPDGKTLYFVRVKHPDNVKGKKDEQDIYVTELKEGEWTEPRNLGKPLNNADPNGVTSVTPDGNSLLLINDYGRSPFQF